MADEIVQHYLYTLSAYGTEEFYPMDGATTNPFKLRVNEDYEEITVTPGDYVSNCTYWDEDPYVLDATSMPLYVYTANNEWKYVGSASDDYLGDSIGCNCFNCSGVVAELDEGDGSFVEGSTCNRIILSPREGATTFDKFYRNSNHRYVEYGFAQSEPIEVISDTITVEVDFGDCYIQEVTGRYKYWWYQYPGVWVTDIYPNVNIPMPAPKYKGHVQLKWTDPPDITDWKPTPATWEGTVIVRKENSAPLHRWDGDKVVRTTTRDKYKSKPYKDEDIETNKVYYYAFMPYYTKIDDPQHPIRYYTFTKCIRVETGTISYIPEIIKIDMNEDVATITYAITLPATGPYDTAKLYGKKDENPACDNTDDIVEDISQVDDQVIVPDIDGDYFFCIQVANGTDTFTSDVVSCSGESSSPIIIIDIPCLSIPKSIEYFTTPPTGTYEDGRDAFSRLGNDLYDSTKAKNTYYTNWQNDDIRIRSRNNNYGYAQTNILDRREGGSSYDLGSHATIPSGSTDSGCYLSIGLDRTDTSKIYLFTVQQTNNNWIYYLSKTIDNSDLYSLLYTLV